MRDLLDKLDKITEATLEPSQIIKYPERFDAFITHIRDGGKFYTDKEGTEVVLDPSEADRFLELKAAGQFRGALSGKDKQGNLWPLSKFRKTAEFGGAGVKPGADSTDELKKEAALAKPSQIGITDKPIPATDLGDVIVNNPVLQSTDYGRAIIGMAQEIMAGEPAVIPPEFAKNEQIKKAIVDYAGEYLGVLAVLYGQSEWLGGPKKRQEFLQWLGSDLGDLTLNFPSAVSNPLADSFASVTNQKTNHTINISSKGTGGGAPPSLSSIKVPDHVKNNPKYQTAVDVIELCQNESIPKPKTVSQVFLMMNLFQERIPKKIPKEFNKYLPWPKDVITKVNDSRKNGTPMPEYQDLFANLDSKGSDGGKLTYVVKRAVMDMVNGGAIPEFQDVILEILDYNFIQQYATAVRGGVMVFKTQWPAKLDGKVTMESKSGGTDPTKGGFSFKLAPKGEHPSANDLMPDDEALRLPDASPPVADLDKLTQKRADIQATRVDKRQGGDEKSLGRKRRS